MRKYAPRHGNRKVEVDDIPLIVELLKSMSIIEVAKKWEVTVGTIANNLSKNGLPNAGEIRKQHRYEYYVHQKKAGKKTPDIARELAVSYTALRKMVSRIEKKSMTITDRVFDGDNKQPITNKKETP